MAIPFCELETEEGLDLKSEARITFGQTIPTIFLSALLIRVFCKVVIYNSTGFPILNKLIISANYKGIRLYNNCEDKPNDERPAIGGPDFNTEIDNTYGPFFQVPEGGKIVVTNYGALWQNFGWITVAGYEVKVQQKDCEDLSFETIDDFRFPIYGSGLYGFSTQRKQYWYGRDFTKDENENLEVSGYAHLPITEKGQTPGEPSDLIREKFSWVWGRPWDKILPS